MNAKHVLQSTYVFVQKKIKEIVELKRRNMIIIIIIEYMQK